MVAWAGGVVVAPAVRIIAPAVDAGVFVASQAVAPASVFHMFAWCSLSAACLLEADVPQAFEGGGIGDVRSWGLGCCWCGGYKDTSDAVGWMREEAGKGTACWTGTDDEDGRLDSSQAGVRRGLVAIDCCCSHV